jgi:putative N-acetylmannosamine-6-phosphate epimerase
VSAVIGIVKTSDAEFMKPRRTGSVAEVREILKVGADVNATDEHGLTPYT